MSDVPTFADLQALREKAKRPSMEDLQKLRQKATLQPFVANQDPRTGMGEAEHIFRKVGLAGRDLMETAAALPAGVGDIANKGVNLATSGINKVAGTKIPQLGSMSDQVSKDLTKAGLPEPVTKTEKNVETASNILGNLPEVANPLVGGLKGITKGLADTPKLSAESLTKATDEMRRISGELYKKAKDAGLVFTQQAGQAIQKHVADALAEIGDIDENLHSGTVSALKGLAKKIEKGDITLQSLDNSRQLLGETASKTDMGRPTGDAHRARAAIKAIDSAMAKIGPADLSNGTPEALKYLDAGRKQWAQSAKFDRIARVVKQADGDPNKVKTLLKKLLKNPEKLRSQGYSKEEIEAIKKASKHGFEAPLQAIGHFGIDPTHLTKGNLALPALAELGGMASNHSAIPVIAAGTVAKPIQKYMADRKTEAMLDFLKGKQ